MTGPVTHATTPISKPIGPMESAAPARRCCSRRCSMGLPINGVAYAAIFIVIVLLVARFTSQLMWRWFLLDTLREVAPPRSAARTSATSSTGSRPACAEKKNLTPTSTGGPLRLCGGVGLAVPPQSRLSGISEDFHPSRPSAARPRAVS